MEVSDDDQNDEFGEELLMEQPRVPGYKSDVKGMILKVRVFCILFTRSSVNNAILQRFIREALGKELSLL